MIRIAICDDNKNDRMQLTELCQRFFKEYERTEEYQIFQYSSGTELMCSHDQPDLLLLDIEMEQMDGLRVKKLLYDWADSPRIVYVTSHEELTRKAFGEKVCGFLTKPVKYEQFYEIMQDICTKIRKERRPQRILTEGAGKQERIALYDILYIEAQDKYVDIHLCDGRKLFDGRRPRHMGGNVGTAWVCPVAQKLSGLAGKGDKDRERACAGRNCPCTSKPPDAERVRAELSHVSDGNSGIWRAGE